MATAKRQPSPYAVRVAAVDKAMKVVKKPTAKKPAAKQPANPYAKRNAALEAELKRRTEGKKPAKGYTYGKNVGP